MQVALREGDFADLPGDFLDLDTVADLDRAFEQEDDAADELRAMSCRPKPSPTPSAPNGQPIGSLCLLDMKPRQLTEREKRLFQEYANEVMEEIAKRSPQTAANRRRLRCHSGRERVGAVARWADG